MTVTFKQKDYGYKVVDQYGDVLGKIDIYCTPSFHPKKQVVVMIDEMKEITKFMGSLECQKELL